MACPIIFVLGFVMIHSLYAHNSCNQTLCSNVCEEQNMSGRCNGNNECDCSYGKNCSAMETVTCWAACEATKLNLKGECCDDQCICKAELKVCPPWKCQEQCNNDPRAKDCLYVTADFCMEYGPIRTCVCTRYVLGEERKDGVNEFNHFQSANATQIDYYRYSIIFALSKGNYE